MTLVLNDRRARYVASGGQTSFDVDFPIDSDADVAVYHKVDLTGVITLLTLTTDYTVTLDGPAPNTADVDLVTGAAVNDIITVEGETDPDRDTDFTTGGDFFAGTVNNAEDRQYRIDQETKRDRDRTVVANRVSPDTFDPTLPDVVSQGSKFLSLAANGLSLAWSALTSTLAVLSDAIPAIPTASGTSGTSADISRADHAHPTKLGGVLNTNGFAVNESKGSAVASAATTDIWATDGNTVHVTGTTTITSFGTAPRIGARRNVIFDDALTLTDGANLNLPGGANITTAAGDEAEVYAETTTLLEVRYSKADGTAVGGGGDLPRSYLAGLTLSNGTDATNDIDIAVGVARSAANDSALIVASAIGKQIDVSWAAGGTPGSPTGGLSSSLTLTNDTWYHVILGLVSDTAEVGFDTSVTGANLVTDHSFANTRRIGSVRRDTATNLAFTQIGDEFLWAVPTTDFNVANPGTSATLRTMTVPTGLKVRAIFDFQCLDTSPTAQTLSLLTSPDQADTAPSASLMTTQTRTDAETSNVRLTLRTNTSGQIRTRVSNSDADVVILAGIHGWIDPLGRNG